MRVEVLDSLPLGVRKPGFLVVSSTTMWENCWGDASCENIFFLVLSAEWRWDSAIEDWKCAVFCGVISREGLRT